MRDVVVVVGAFDDRGGVQLRWRRLASALSRNRQVTVVTWRRALLPRRSEVDGYRVIHLPAIATWGSDHRKPVETVNTVTTIVGGTLALLLLRSRWEVAIGAGLHPEGVVAGLAARLLGRRFIAETWLVGPRGNVARLRGSKLRVPVVTLLSRAHAVLAATDAAGTELRALGVPTGRINRDDRTFVGPGFAPATPDRRRCGRTLLGATSPRILLYAGRFDLGQKPLDLLAAAWSGVSAPGWELVLVGDGADLGVLEALADGCDSRMRVLGWSDDVPTLLAGADGFVLPTEFESPGYGLFEGMATGLPGLASDIDVYRDLMPAGIDLVRNDVSSWRAALQHFVDASDDERSDRGSEARSWVEAHVRDDPVGRFEELIDR